jgi:hypothetical protein
VSGTPATFVLGQSGFDQRRPNHGRGDADGDGYSDAAESGMFYPTGVATDGTHLFVADRLNHRVLIWDDLAAIANDKPADRVLGQPSFASVLPNHGNGGEGGSAPAPDGLNLPTGVTLAGSSLWVADTENNRVVRYDDVFGTATPALFLGQSDGSSLNNPNSEPPSSVDPGNPLHPPTTTSSVLRPRAVAVTDGALYVSETDSNRVHVFTRASGSAPWLPQGQLGQPTDVSSVFDADGIGPRAFGHPEGATVAGSRLFVADAGNHRVVAWDVTATPGPGAGATLVLGQPSFVASGFDQSVAGGSPKPHGLALSRGDIFIVERARNRVLVQELPLVSGKSPAAILGEPDASLSVPNAGGPPSAETLSSPQGIHVDDDHIVIADTGNHRVIIRPRDPNAPASLVLGQASFTENAPNRGASATAATLRAPQAVVVDGPRLVVADTGNHRVLVWRAFPTTNGQPADIVLGQADFAGDQSNRGAGVATATTLAVPAGVLFAAGRLFVADLGNNRVVSFDDVGNGNGRNGGNGAPASIVLGQPDFTSRTATVDINDRTRLAGPTALASDGTNLFVGDHDAQRVVTWELATLTSSSVATGLLNANGGLGSASPAGLAVERTALFTSRLYVSDDASDRVLVLGSVSRLVNRDP